MKLRLFLAGLAVLALPAVADARDVTFKVHAISEAGVGEPVGIVRLVDSQLGLRIVPRLRGLPPGDHGFHIHTEPDCGAKPDASGKSIAGLAAGGHWDPDKAGKHLGPHGAGHKGDLPVLKVGADGTAKSQITVRRLKVADVLNRSLMIHAGGDNFSDQPAALGGGGARIACGVIR